MKIGFIGLGRMGSNMVLNLIDGKHSVVVYNRSIDKVKKMERLGAVGSVDYVDFFKKMGSGKKLIFIMITAGKPVDLVLNSIKSFLKKNDVVIDSGNSYYKDSVGRFKFLKRIGVDFLDIGVSGGIEGARHGACMMIGGDRNIYLKNKKLFSSMCVENGFGYMGKTGSGHFVKGVHNAIEYGVLGAFNEGFDVLEKERKKFGLNLKEISKVYNNGSIIEGRISGWVQDVFFSKKNMNELSCMIPFGETEKEMGILEKRYSMGILREARLMRRKSRRGDFCGKLIAGVRHKFGGHKF